jgi:dynactin complex subunit
MAIIFEFRRVRMRGKMQFGDGIFYSIELSFNRGEYTTQLIPS